jgi:hypothetical protein
MKHLTTSPLKIASLVLAVMLIVSGFIYFHSTKAGDLNSQVPFTRDQWLAGRDHVHFPNVRYRMREGIMKTIGSLKTREEVTMLLGPPDMTFDSKQIPDQIARLDLHGSGQEASGIRYDTYDPPPDSEEEEGIVILFDKAGKKVGAGIDVF